MKKSILLVLSGIIFCSCNANHIVVQTDTRKLSEAQREKAQWEESQERFENDLHGLTEDAF